MSNETEGLLAMELDAKDIGEYMGTEKLRESEYLAWSLVVTALSDYVKSHVDIWNAGELDALRSTYLPNLFDSIVFSFQDEYPSREVM